MHHIIACRLNSRIYYVFSLPNPREIQQQRPVLISDVAKARRFAKSEAVEAISKLMPMRGREYWVEAYAAKEELHRQPKV